MITLEHAKEIVEFLEESLSNTFFHKDVDLNKKWI